jgi:lipid-A-disaccharide synthase
MTQLTTKKIYIIAGEASGDLHGSNLLKEFIQQNNECNSPLNLQFRYWGGDKMEEAIGQKPIKHFKDLAFMGFVEVLANIRTILGNIAFCKKDIEAFQPDALLLIDYPGFNLRIAEWAKLKGIKIYYYISPTVWAWKESRVYKIKKAVDHMFVILPFEKPFYDKYNYHVDYVGHPLLDAIDQYRFIQKDRVQFIHENKLNQAPIIAILPGSRKQEIRKKLPVMLEAVKDLTNYQIIVAGAPSLDHSFYQEFIKSNSVKIVHGKTYDLLSASEAAIVTSGTATLETALLDIPEVVCYKTSKISYSIAKRLVKIKFISLVNLIMDKEVVRELIQDDCTSETIKTELSYILEGGKNRNRILNEYQEMKKILGEGGASKKVAQLMLKTIQD